MPQYTAAQMLYNRLRLCYVLFAIAILSFLIKTWKAGVIANIGLATSLAFLCILWQSYKSTFRLLPESSEPFSESEQKLSQSLWLLAFVAGGALIVGLSCGLVLGKELPR